MQKKVNFKKLFSLCLCILLVAAIAMFTTACTKNTESPDSGTSTSTEDMGTYGQGKTSFTFCVADVEGKEFYYAINTDKTTVGEALIELELISGDEGPYGLYIKTVTGTTLEYDTDGMYWAFYIGEEMSATGVDMTDITAGETYRLVATKG